MILSKLVVPSIGNADITGDTAIASAIFSTDVPLVNCFFTGWITRRFHILRNRLGGLFSVMSLGKFRAWVVSWLSD